MPARRAVGAAILLATAACGESLLEPRTPERLAIPQPLGRTLSISEALPVAAAEDEFWGFVPAQEQERPAPIRPRSVSLGFIGDEPIGWYPTTYRYRSTWSPPWR